MKSIVYLTILGIVVFASCKKKEETPTPSACFMVDKTGSTDPTHNFVFTNCSDNFSSASWNFGDGHSSDDFNPSHRFNNIGEYTVTLTAINSNGLTSTNTRTITIGHYTLTKIIYNKLNSTINFPKHAYFSRFDSQFGMVYNNDATINTSSQIPFSVNLPDNVMYDNHYSFYYRFSENDLAGHSYVTNYFNISDLDIVNGKVDKTFLYSTDTAKVSLYFQIVPR
jgi:PKD repeat protein